MLFASIGYYTFGKLAIIFSSFVFMKVPLFEGRWGGTWVLFLSVIASSCFHHELRVGRKHLVCSLVLHDLRVQLRLLLQMKRRLCGQFLSTELLAHFQAALTFLILSWSFFRTYSRLQISTLFENDSIFRSSSNEILWTRHLHDSLKLLNLFVVRFKRGSLFEVSGQYLLSNVHVLGKGHSQLAQGRQINSVEVLFVLCIVEVLVLAARQFPRLARVVLSDVRCNTPLINQSVLFSRIVVNWAL